MASANRAIELMIKGKGDVFSADDFALAHLAVFDADLKCAFFSLSSLAHGIDTRLTYVQS